MGEDAVVREFSTGATRDDADAKPDYEGFESPLVMESFGRYMHHHRLQADGNLRDSDNWQKGIPRKQYLKSLLRHTIDIWLIMRGFGEKAKAKDLEEALNAVKFNVNGLLFEVLIGRDVGNERQG